MKAAERETIIRMSDDDEQVSIWTCQPRIVGKLKRDHRFEIIRSGAYSDSTRWVEAQIPIAEFTFGGKRRVVLTDEQRAAAGARLRAGRNPHTVIATLVRATWET